MPSKYRPVTPLEQEKLKREQAQVPSPKPRNLTDPITGENTPEPEQVGLGWRAAGLGTRVGSGILSGIVGAVPTPITTPLAAAIGGGGEALAQKLDTPSGTPLDKSTIALEAGLSAVPMGKIFSSGRKLVNIARGAGLAEVGNLARRWNQDGTLLPDTPSEGAWDALAVSLGGLGGAFTPVRGAKPPAPPKTDPLEDVIQQVTAQHGPPRPHVEYTDSGTVLTHPDTPRLVRRGGASLPPSPPPTKVTKIPVDPLDPNSPNGASVEGYTPTPPRVKEAERKAADSLISHDNPLKDFNKAGFDADDISKAERQLNESVRKAETKGLKAEESADLQQTRTAKGGTDVGTIEQKVEKAAKANNVVDTREIERDQKNLGKVEAWLANKRTKAAAAAQKAREEQAAADKIAADKAGMVPSDPIVVESSKVKTPEGTESSKTVWRKPPPEVDEDGGGGGTGPTGPKPTYSVDKIPPREQIAKTTYTNKREAIKHAEAYGGAEGGVDVVKVPGGYVVKFPEAPTAPVKPKGPLGPAAQKFQSKVDEVLTKTLPPEIAERVTPEHKANLERALNTPLRDGPEPPAPVAPKPKKPKGGGGGSSGGAAPTSSKRGAIPAVKSGPKALGSSPEEMLEKTSLHGGKMTKAEAEAHAVRLGGRVSQYSPRKYTVLFDDIEAERNAARAAAEAPANPKAPEKFDAPRSNGSKPIPVDTSYMGGLTPDEFSRYMNLAPSHGVKRTAEELAEWRALAAKKDGPVKPPSSTKTAKFAESDQAGDELDALLTATRGPDWDKVKINPAGHGTLPTASPDEAVSIMEDLANKANKAGPTLAKTNFPQGKISGSQLPPSEVAQDMFGGAPPKADNLFEQMSRGDAPSPLVMNPDRPTVGRIELPKPKPSSPPPIAAAGADAPLPPNGDGPASANFFRNRADALGDLNPYGYKATKAAEAAGEIPDSPHFRKDDRGRPYTPARMQGAELSKVRKVARENPTAKDLENAGKWFTDRPRMAQSFTKGQRGHMSYVDVPKDVADKAMRKPASPGANEFLLDSSHKANLKVVTPEDLKNLPEPAPGHVRLFRGMGTQEAVNTVELTSDSLSKMTPQQQSKALSEIVKKFTRQAKDQKGAITAEALTQVGLGSAGALAGAASMPDDPLTGAILGATAGVATPAVARALINRVATNPNMGAETMKEVAYKIEDSAKTFFRMLPDYQRFNLLADVRNLPINAWVGPYGSAVMSSIEHLLSGDTRGWQALKMLGNPKNFPREWWNARTEAGTLIANASERTEGQLGRAGPEWFRWMTSQPGEAMTAGDVAARNILMKAGFSPEEARRITLTSDPYSPGGRAISNFKKGAQSEDGKKSWFINMILPFYRTATNQLEQSAERAPLFLGMLWQRYVGGAPKVNLGRQLAQQGISNGVVAPISYVIGLNTDDENVRWVNKFINNFAGQYGAIATAAFMAGQASRNNKSIVGAVQRSLNESTPLPTLDIVNKVGSLVRDWTDDNRPDRTLMQKMPVKMVPGFMDPDNELSFPSVIGNYLDPPKPERNPVRAGRSKYRPVSKRQN
jgi:hypothetical protein